MGPRDPRRLLRSRRRVCTGVGNVGPVLFLSARVGVGHTAAADAVRARLEARGIRGETVDSYRYAASFFSKVVSDGYIGMVRTIPQVYGFIYDRAERAKEAGGFRVWAAEFTARNLQRLITRMRPSVVVCTHAFPCNAMSAYKRLYDPELPVFGIVTDFVVHPFWIYRNIDAYAVATPEMRSTMIARGVEADRVRVDGIPVDLRFAERTRSRAEIRAALGLPPDRPVMLVMGGGLGLGPVATTTRALAQLDREVTAVVIVGRNARLKRQVEEAAANYPYETRVLGFVDNVADYMLASDILLTKPGGLTTTEALSAEVPMILVRPLPGQEQRNARFLEQRGAALRADRSRDIARLVAELLDDPASDSRLHIAVRQLRKPFAAETIAGRIAELGTRATARYAYGE
ncbi:MAG: glycosyltransferase [Candidatus Velthaea sp.]